MLAYELGLISGLAVVPTCRCTIAVVTHGHAGRVARGIARRPRIAAQSEGVVAATSAVWKIVEKLISIYFYAVIILSPGNIHEYEEELFDCKQAGFEVRLFDNE